MSHRITQRPRARLDLLEQFVYFGEQAEGGLGERYFDAVFRTCERLVEHPHSGRSCDLEHHALQGMRRAPVQGFANYLIFYLPQPDGIEIVRVLHGARDLGNLFSEGETEV